MGDQMADHLIETEDGRKIRAPIVNINGTSREQLVKQYTDAMIAIENAGGLLQNSAPHGRDYQTLPTAEFNLAMSEHRTREKALLRVLHDLTALVIHLRQD